MAEKRVRRRVAAVALAVGALGLSGAGAANYLGSAPITHKAGHQYPPGCAKVKQKYNKPPKQKCPKHPPPSSSSSSSNAKGKGK